MPINGNTKQETCTNLISKQHARSDPNKKAKNRNRNWKGKNRRGEVSDIYSKYNVYRWMWSIRRYVERTNSQTCTNYQNNNKAATETEPKTETETEDDDDATSTA